MADLDVDASNMIPRWVRRCERFCCQSITYFPLVFVYSITTWGVWVVWTIGFSPTRSPWLGKGVALLAALLYGMALWSYTTAVFTSPGTTTDQNHGYSSLPTHASRGASALTVKSNGELRFCKKCQSRKPDRAHHCRSCNACVLKMDHHCPWLATCVGLRNYKPFILFLIYTTIYCMVCSFASSMWLWTEIFADAQYSHTLMPVNYVMLSIISSIIGLVLGGFTGWHILLASRGQTTIECLEKTRYLSPLRQTMKPDHIATGGVQHSYEELERQRARARYQEYLNDQDSTKLPNAFDLGWRQNLLHLFGPNRWLWAVPICNTTGDGWAWEPSQKWLEAREEIRKERDLQRQREHAAGWGPDPTEYDDFVRSTPAPEPVTRHYLTSSSEAPISSGATAGRRTGSKADRILGRDPSQYLDDPHAVPLRTLKRRDEVSDDSGDEEMSATPTRNPLPFRTSGLRSASNILGRASPKVGEETAWDVHNDEID